MSSNQNVMSVKNWIVTLIMLIIPIVNIIMLFVWAFGGNVNLNKQNYAKASLILIAIVLVIYILIFAVFMGAIRSF